MQKRDPKDGNFCLYLTAMNDTYNRFSSMFNLFPCHTTGCLLVSLIQIPEPKKKTTTKDGEKGYFFQAGQCCHRLVSENGILVGRGYVFTTLKKKRCVYGLKYKLERKNILT